MPEWNIGFAEKTVFTVGSSWGGAEIKEMLLSLAHRNDGGWCSLWPRIVALSEWMREYRSPVPLVNLYCNLSEHFCENGWWSLDPSFFYGIPGDTGVSLRVCSEQRGDRSWARKTISWRIENGWVPDQNSSSYTFSAVYQGRDSHWTAILESERSGPSSWLIRTNDSICNAVVTQS